jgi:hypothetical protein
MPRPEDLPQDFLQKLATLEASYLAAPDPLRQSGFGGGARRWQAERGPILDALDRDGSFLDIGCANGYLLECLRDWAWQRRRIVLEPHGLDQGAGLIALAKQRLPEYADNLHVGNGWNWRPPCRFQFVYTLNDCVPAGYLAAYLKRIIEVMILPGGRLIVGAYGSRSSGTPPMAVAETLQSMGMAVAGTSSGGDPPVTAFAWTDC